MTEQPLFSVVAGNPTDEELAALTAVVLSLQPAEKAAGDPAVASHRGRPRAWVRNHLRAAHLLPGPGAWKRTFR